MKKILLSAMVLFAAMAVNAQTEVGTADSDFAGTLTSDGISATAGSVLHEGTYITWSIACDDTWKSGGTSAKYTINETDVKSSGAVASNNPQTDGTNVSGSSTSLPNSGGAFNFEAKADGYLYILFKSNTKRCYVVWEDGTRIPYIFGCSEATDGTVISYDLSKLATLNDDGTISDDYTIQSVDEINNSSYENDCQGSVVKFAVKNGSTYTFCGTTTKVAVGAYYYDTTGDATITYSDDNYTYTLIEPTSDDEGDVTEGDDDLVEQCLYSTDFQDWAEVDASSEEQTVTVTTDYSSESLVFTLDSVYVKPEYVNTDEKFEGTGAIEINTNKDADDNSCVTTSALSSITKVVVDYGTTGSNRGLDVYAWGDGDSDWVQVLDGKQSKTGGYTETITVNKENCQLKFESADSGNFVYLLSLAIYGKVSSDSESGTTGINNAAIVSSNVENGAIYNLAGQRLSKLTKGINIVNGKKIFVK